VSIQEVVTFNDLVIVVKLELKFSVVAIVILAEPLKLAEPVTAPDKDIVLAVANVVAVVAFVFAVLFWLIDLAFSTGIMNMLPQLVKYLKGLGA
jgi:hypothetical protein